MSGRLTPKRVAGALALRAGAVKRRFMPSFRRGLEDSSVSLSLDMDNDSRALLIAFGGIQGGLQIPPFEFFNATGALPIKRMFVRDLRQSWYHRGVRGHGSNILELSDSLAQLVSEHEVDRLVVTGTSMGGYACLLFGALLGADRAIAFAPQTVLARAVLAELGDHRWDEDLDRVEAAGPLDERWVDLARALPEARRAQTRCDVLFDPAIALDKAQCIRLEGLPGVQLISREGGGHQIARDMRDAGELEPLLRDALVGSARTA